VTSPSWLGIGAQRSGTTWVTGLLCQHPSVELSTTGKKEMRLLHRVADGGIPVQQYLDLMPDDGLNRGEWTPHYMRHPSVAPMVARELNPELQIFVLLRDPVDRFSSSMRFRSRLKKPLPLPMAVAVQSFTGCYADQLDLWASFVGRDRMHVLIYEEAANDPQAAVNQLWKALDLGPVELTGTEEKSSSTSRRPWEWPEGMKEALTVMYRPQSRRLIDDWGLDLSSWPSLQS